MAAFSTLECACSEVYRRSLGRSRPAIPRVRMPKSKASRAAATAHRVATEAVSMITPNCWGSPSICRSQSSVTCSSSVAAGLVRHSMPFTLSAADSISPSTPGAEPVMAKYAKKAGWFQWVIPGRIARSKSANTASKGSGSCGGALGRLLRTWPGLARLRTG
ncbi:hypothetical protein HRbin32_01200 [bacterium HR32]|nr:hypothetical protein HRbin32_01200 [bacterium HR32]